MTVPTAPAAPLRARTFRIGLLLAIGVAMLAFAVDSAGAPKNEVFAEQTARMQTIVASITKDRDEVAASLAQAEQAGHGIQMSCIAENLKVLEKATEVASLVEKGWPSNPHSAAYPARALERLEALRVLSTDHLRRARECVDGTTLTVQISTKKDSSKVELPPVSPIRLERPPLASTL